MQRIRNVRIVDVAGGLTSPPRSLVLSSGRIQSILAPGKPLAEAFDASGRFLAPGLIDSHVHFFFDCGAAPRETFEVSNDDTRLALARRNALVAINAGVTTMRDCGGPAALVFSLAREIASGATPGPHLLCSGSPLTRPGGHCHFLGGEVETATDVRRRVESQLASGATFVKLMASGGGLTPGTDPAKADFPAEMMRAAVEVAHSNGAQVAAHCHATESIARAIEARVDMVEHASFVEPSGRYQFDPQVARRLCDTGLAVSPTVIAALRTARRFKESGVAHNPTDVSAVARLEGRLANVGHFHRLGARILAGTDCGCTDTPFNSLVDELHAYVSQGMTKLEALRSATAAGAAILGLRDVGEVKAGARADLILLDQNPLDDLEALRDPWMVWKAGTVVHERTTPTR